MNRDKYRGLLIVMVLLFITFIIASAKLSDWRKRRKRNRG